MRYEWFLFDLDGTLTESGEGIIASARHALRVLGAEMPSDEEMARFIGPPLLWSFVHVAGLSESKARRAMEIYRARYAQKGWMENRVYPGIAPLLCAIRKRGGHIALASAKPEFFCRRILEYFGLMPYFDRVVGISMSDNAAEKVDIIRRAMPEDADPNACVMVGDRSYDIEGARLAGIDSVGVLYGYGAREEFAGAKHVVSTVAELHEYLVGARDRGNFITFEGGDGCGKSTQFQMAAEYLTQRGWEVVSSREPGGCPIAERIRDLVLDVNAVGMTAECEALLYAAARAQHVREVIRPAIESGKIMLSDRFLDSSIAYQAYGRELTEPVIRQINALAVDGLEPDLTLYYATDLQTARARMKQGGEADRIEREGDAFMLRVDRGFQTLAEREPHRIVKIDALRGIREVFRDTARVISGLIDQRS